MTTTLRPMGRLMGLLALLALAACAPASGPSPCLGASFIDSTGACVSRHPGGS